MKTTPFDWFKASAIEHLQKCSPHGESLSFLKSVMKDKGYKNLGCNSDFANLLKNLGFRIEYRWSKPNRSGHSYITKTTIHLPE